MIKKFIIIFCFLCLLTTYIRAEYYDLSDKKEVKTDIKNRAEKLYPGVYIDQKMYSFDQEQAYNQVLNWKRTSQYQLILTDIINKYYPDFIRIVEVYKEEIKAYTDLKNKQESILRKTD